jgi:hypothetical protein
VLKRERKAWVEKSSRLSEHITDRLMRTAGSMGIPPTSLAVGLEDQVEEGCIAYVDAVLDEIDELIR